MWPLLVLFSLTAAAGAFLVSQEAALGVAVQAQDASLARNLAVYRSLVVEHVRAAGVASGTVPDSALAFPGWYQRHPAWTNTVLADGTVVVYASGAVLPTLAAELTDFTQGSMLAGEARNAPGGGLVLYSPRHGDTGIALPPMRAGTPVWLARLD
jgi:hypothetical protein